MEAIKSFVNFIVRLIVINIVLILFFGSAPLLYVAVPFWYLFHPSPYFGSHDMATVVMLTGPFACGFWMTVICHWHTVRKAQREGRLDRWRETEGGMVSTVGKSIGFMVMGWIGSAVTETIFSILARPLLRTMTGRMEFFALAPFAVFAPVLLVWLRRRIKNDRDKFGAASLHAKNV